MEREVPKVKVDTVIKLCTEGIELLSQGKVQETINGFMHTLEMARQMLAVHNSRGDVFVRAKVQLGEVLPGTRGKVIKNDEMGMLVHWETVNSRRPLVDLFLRDQFENYIELEGQCTDHHSH
ncbi:hypothetical protein Desca_2459 [Desulfotomaculum nigrificans CO-1-SRB]|uniref:Uncharacterized protein n=1 Tax=Desulfotomaculum nigrificans (strain DSM 14880 / VKM B-2319 / CO-1-SRB) TaxID=868595 RepID=F6B4B0_DESCC|nr:hypothetical protein [Desulfotomaculum nigrificans]AEF95287.1 hypothetical protein Desca_2459 [Desulfotomaculum nigrificans CO-1-SRB]